MSKNLPLLKAIGDLGVFIFLLSVFKFTFLSLLLIPGLVATVLWLIRRFK